MTGGQFLVNHTGSATDKPNIRIQAYRPNIRWVDLSSNTHDAEIAMDGNKFAFRISKENTNGTTKLTERMSLTTSQLTVGVTTLKAKYNYWQRKLRPDAPRY